jgi:23S rRNA (cytosine1962-C5)-methyltransferase
MDVAWSGKSSLEELEAGLNEGVLLARLEEALRRRGRIRGSETTAFRLVNSTGDLLPGLFVDVYGEHAVCQFERSPVANLKAAVVEWLRARLGVVGVYEKSDTYNARLRGLQNVRTIWGHVPNFLPCRERGVSLLVAPTMSKTGFFLDLRDCREFVESLALNATILNAFAFTCSISLFALRGGARLVTNVDKNGAALALGERLHLMNGLHADKSAFVRRNMWSFFKDVRRSSSWYDIVVLDPPEFEVREVNVAETERKYRELNAAASEVTRPDGGILVTTCCSHGFPLVLFEAVVRRVVELKVGAAELFWSAGPPADHPLSSVDASLSYLRILAFRFGAGS